MCCVAWEREPLNYDWHYLLGRVELKSSSGSRYYSSNPVLVSMMEENLDWKLKKMIEAVSGIIGARFSLYALHAESLQPVDCCHSEFQLSF